MTESPASEILKEMSTINELKQRNIDVGQHFFDEDAMRFFDSQIHPDVFGNYFVTSEALPDTGLRRYTVRYMDWESGIVWTQGMFLGYKTLRDAYDEAKRLSQVSSTD